MNEIQFYPLGDAAITVQFGKSADIAVHNKVRGLVQYLEDHPLPGMIELVPGFTTVTVFYDPIKLLRLGQAAQPYEQIRAALERIVVNSYMVSEEPRVITIPVCYGEEFGPDLQEVAEFTGMTPEEVIGFHAGRSYTVYMIGFAPGFPYLGGMSEKLAVPRRSSPRLVIAAGSVGIGGKQTGIYPLESPGGWQIIGRTPLRLFNPIREQPSLLQAGDIIRFQPIPREEYEALGREAE